MSYLRVSSFRSLGVLFWKRLLKVLRVWLVEMPVISKFGDLWSIFLVCCDDASRFYMTKAYKSLVNFSFEARQGGSRGSRVLLKH